MASVVEILARLRADSSQFITEMAKAQRATEGLDKAANKTGSILSGKLKIGLFAAGAAAGAFAVKLGMESVRAAQQAGVAHDRLARLLITTNGATEEGIKILNQQAKALEAVTVVTESNITTVQSQLATFDLHGSTIARLTPAILDYVVAEKGAAASADQYRQMTNGLAQALNGQFASLTAVGFVLDAETKKRIKSGTEAERSAAIVDVLNSTYKDFSRTAGGTAAGSQIKLANSIRNVQQAFGTALLPVIQKVQGTIGQKLVPMLEQLQQKFGNAQSIEKFMQFMGGLLSSVVKFAKGLSDVLVPIFTTVLIPAFKLAVGAIIGFIKVLGKIGEFLSKYSVIVTMVVVGIGAYVVVTKLAVLATLGYQKALLLVKVAQQAYAFWTYTTTGATVGLAGAMNLLKTAFLTNPIGIIIAAVIALGVGFKLAWEKSETFRKIVIGAIQGVLSAVSGGLRFLGKLPGGLGKFFTESADDVDKFSKSLDKMKTITKKTKDAIVKPSVEMPDLTKLGASTKGAPVDPKAIAKAEAAAKRLAEMKNNLQKAVSNYNDYLQKEFKTSFMNGADSAADAVMGALDKLESVFEAKGKMLSGGALAKLRAEFAKVNAEVRGMIDGYAELAGKIELVSDQLEKAGEALEEAIAERASAMKRFGDLMRTPFGEPSQIDKALRSAESTVDSIIDMYDQLVEVINQRFTGLAPGARDAVKNFLYAQANGLIDAARMRTKAIKVLEASQERLNDLVDSQKSFSKSLTNSMRSFATAIADLSKTDSKATITVVKTATGLVITQLKKSSGGLDTITQQLKDRLATIATFAANAQKLLSSGLNKDYVRQLLEAGPEAAGLAVAALTTASAAQIAEINSLYAKIGVISDEFGTNISSKMYDEAIAMATAFRDGAAIGVELINAAMSDIVTNINRILSVLGNTGLTNAQALINALVAEFTAMSEEKVGPATQIVVDKIKLMIGVLGAVGLENAQSFINGLLAALTGKDNLAAVDLSATTIKTNIDTIMKLLSPEALTNGLGLINSLIGAFGGTNLTNVIASATSVKDGIVTALNSLRTLGTELASDLMQGAYNELLDKKDKLVKLAESIATAIATAMKNAAAAIQVGVDDLGGGDGGDIVDKRGLDLGGATIAPKVVAPKVVIPKTIAKPPLVGGIYGDMYKAGINPNIKTKVALPPQAALGQTKGSTFVKPALSATKPTFMSAAKSPVTVNITAPKVAATVTATTIANAISKARNAKRG